MSNTRIHHIIRDLKFFNGVYYQFEGIPEIDNKYHIVKSEHFTAVTEQNLVDKNNIFIYDTIEDLIQHSENFGRNEVIYIHSLHKDFIKLKDYLKTLKCIATIFGYEVYNNRYIYDESLLYDTITFGKFSKQSIKPIDKWKNKYYPLLRKYLGLKLISIKDHHIKQFNNIDILALPYEEEMIKMKKILNQDFHYLPFIYYPLEKMVTIDAPIHSDKRLIQIGNSASISNNHLDVFKKIERLVLKNDSVVIPVAYGEKDYIEELKNAISFQATIEFQETFVPSAVYNQMLNEVKIAIFNTRRQQAFGNIIALVYAGAKVFISEYNSVYQYLKNNGIKVYSYEKALNTAEWKGLSIEDMHHNRQTIYSLLNEAHLRSELKQSLQKMKIIE